MVRFVLISITLILTVRAYALAAPATRPLLPNGDFETIKGDGGTPDGWPAAKDGISYEVESGNHFLRLRSPEPGKVILAYRAVTLTPDIKAMQLTFRARCEDIKHGKENWYDGRIMMNFKDAAGTVLKPGPKHPNFQGTSKDWKEQTVYMVVPDGAKILEIMPTLFQAQSGTLDIDDLKLVAVEPGTRPSAAVPATGPTAGLKVPAPPAEKLPKELKVAGNQIKDSAGKAVWLQGLAIPSLEWSVAGENLLKSVEVGIDGWKSNVIRLPVSDKMWFGNGPHQNDGGAGYRQTVDNVVNTAAGRGAYLVLDLHVFRAPTDEHVAFWKDAAARYKNNPAVLYELFNEPHDISWEVWQKGGEVTDKKKSGVVAENAEKITKFDSPGMQKLVDTVRQTGAKNIIIAGGLDWGYDLSGILTGHALDDREGNGIVYSSHVYPWKSDWKGKFLTVAEKYPIFVGETGCEVERMPFIPPERHEDPYTWAPDMLALIQKHKLHWTAWCFHNKATPRVISDWNYTPTPFWGAFVKKALAGEAFELKKMR